MSSPISGVTGGLAEALNILLDKGLVIDVSIKVTVIGIEILAIEIKLVLASVDTYIRYLEAMQRLEIARRAANNGETPPVVTASQGLAGTYGLLPTAVPVPVAVGPAPSTTTTTTTTTQPEEK